jgi:hypothetical protein
LAINVYQIVSIAEQGKTKGKYANIHFSKDTIMKLNQLLDNTFDAIKDKVNAEIEEAENSKTSIDASSESEEEEVKTTVSK